MRADWLRPTYYAGTLTALALCIVSVPADAFAKTYAGNCGLTGYLAYKPKYWSSGCTGGSFNIERLNWSRWSGGSARGTGRVQLRDPQCRPTCPEAKIYRYAGKITLSRPRTCRDDSGTARRYFSRVIVRVKWTAGNPFDEPAGWQAKRFTIRDGGCTLSP